MSAPAADHELNAVIARLVRDGTITRDKALASYGVLTGPLSPESIHRVALVLWDLITSRGIA